MTATSLQPPLTAVNGFKKIVSIEDEKAQPRRSMADRILVAEDDNLTRAAICDLLRKEGYDVIEASNGVEAIELFSNEHVDVVITDYYMPYVDGVALVEKIHASSPETPVVFMTGYLSRKSAETILQGRAEYMAKPISLEILQSTLQRFRRSKLL
jgi:CheY-like chemotaxis protein